MTFLTEWTAAARRLEAPRTVTETVGAKLARAYASPLRAYHTKAHILFLINEIRRHDAAITDPDRLVFAAFFHDAIYRPWRDDNEARSAAFASLALPDLRASEALTWSVRRLIVWTADHVAPEEADADDLLFLDMDMAILGAPAAEYEAYATAIRREYWFAPPKRYRTGRAAFLTGVLERERVFRTEAYEAERGRQARENMTRERDRLIGSA